jgi:hypothetical protein
MKGPDGLIMRMLQQKYIAKRLSTRRAMQYVVPNGVQRSKLRPCNSPPAAISERTCSRKGAFAMSFKGLRGDALLVVTAQCCDEHRRKELCVFAYVSSSSNYKHVSHYQNTFALFNVSSPPSQQGLGHHAVAMKNDEGPGL